MDDRKQLPVHEGHKGFVGFELRREAEIPHGVMLYIVGAGLWRTLADRLDEPWYVDVYENAEVAAVDVRRALETALAVLDEASTLGCAIDIAL